MAATFLKACNQEIGQSLFEDDLLETAVRLMDKAKQNGVRLVMPVDVIVTDDIAAEDKAKTVPIDEIPPNMLIADIGPQTIKNFYDELRRAKTIFWNGPMGIYERPRFSEGTRAVAKLLAGSQAATIIGGGSTAEIVTNMGLADKMSFVSTGGGASMQFLSGESLPGVEELLDVGARVRVSR